jgi:VanZ family protein
MVPCCKKIFFYWLPPALWMGLIFFLSSFNKLQASEVAWQDFVTRKTAHFLEYAILCFLFYRGLKNTTRLSLARSLVLSFTLSVLYAISDEYHQTWVPGRTGKLFDTGIDSVGAAFGVLFSGKIVNLLPEKVKKVVL